VGGGAARCNPDAAAAGRGAQKQIISPLVAGIRSLQARTISRTANLLPHVRKTRSYLTYVSEIGPCQGQRREILAQLQKEKKVAPLVGLLTFETQGGESSRRFHNSCAVLDAVRNVSLCQSTARIAQIPERDPLVFNEKFLFHGGPAPGGISPPVFSQFRYIIYAARIL